MATQVAQKFYDLLRKHFETGVPWQNMNFTDDQKRRIEVCLDAYKRFEADPFMDLSLYIKNKWGRSYSELKNDLKVVEYISSFYAQGQRNISTMKVRHAANIMMRNGADTGNMKAVNDGATLLFKLDRLDQPETPEELGDELIRMPLVVTSDVKKKFPTKTSHEAEEMKKIRKTWGVKIDQWQDMIENDEGVYIPDIDENGLQMEDNTDTERESGQDRFTQLEEEE